jgi:hypothetical protein
MGELERRIPRDAHLEVDNPKLQPWIDALVKIDRDRSRGTAKGDLIQLLRSKAPMPRLARWHLADLLDRYNLKIPRGKNRQTPSYDHSKAEGKLILAAKMFRRYRAREFSFDRAIDYSARTYEITSEKLRTYLAGKYTSARRIARRRPPRDGL